MKTCFLILIAVLAFQACTPLKRQTVSTSKGQINVFWSKNIVSKIDCTNQEIPGGFLHVIISRGKNWKSVVINSDQDEIWSRELLKSAENRGSSKGIIFKAESKFIGHDCLKTEEWMVESTGLLIYKEAILVDEYGRIKQQQFFGPFGIILKPQVIDKSQ